MLISSTSKFVQTPFNDESEIESIVLNNYEYLFGPESFLLPKKLIKTEDGEGTIPDAYVIDLKSRRWFVIEVELSRHDVWKHIAPQVSKQIIAAQKDWTRKLLTDVAVKLYEEDTSISEIFDNQNISKVNIRKILTEIFETEPVVALPIDSVSSDLNDWAHTFGKKVKLWTVKKYTELNNSPNIIYEFPEEFKPIVDTLEELASDQPKDESRQYITYDVTIFDLMQAKLLKEGDKLTMLYKPRTRSQQEFEGIIENDGSISVEGRIFSSLSDAAVFCIQKAGSKRKTENGWLKWKNIKGILLSDIRFQYLKMKH